MHYLRPLATIVIAGLLSVAISGCDRTVGPLDGNPSGRAAFDFGSTSVSPDPEQDPDLEEITVRIADRAAYDEVIASHKGKVVLVDFWATWCGPCVEQFPHTVELGRTIQPSKLAVVSVSMDEPEDKEKVLAFLQDKGAAFDNLISKYGVGQEGFDAFEITDGAVPHYKIYDRTGTLRHTAGSSEEIDRLIVQLLD